MEDDKGLDLSLGLLPCGGGTESVIGKINSASDEIDRDSKLINDFKNFLEGGTVNHDSGLAAQRSDPIKTEDNFFNNLSKAPTDADSSKSLNGGGLGAASESRSTEVDVGKKVDVGEKRKTFFGESSQSKKLEKEAHHSDLLDKTRASHISITTDEGSTAENEDVADSEAVGSSSRLIDGSKRNTSSGGPPEIQKELHRISDSSTSSVELSGQRRFSISTEKEIKFGAVPNVNPFSPQTVSMMNMTYSVPGKDANTTGTSSTSNYQLPGAMQVMAATNSERAGSQPVILANLPSMYGFSTVQIPTLDKDNSPGIISHQQQLLSSYGGRGQFSDKHNEVFKISHASTPVNSHKSSEPTQYDGRGIDHVKVNGKHGTAVEGSSLRVDNDAKGSNMIFRSAPSEQPKSDAIPSDYPSIRPGIAAEVKFGGCGSYPNLPWVSTTGPGPNGKTISGVTYRFSPTQIRIVCACHGSHMSPEEFIRHASEAQANAKTGTSAASFPSSNPAASAQG